MCVLVHMVTGEMPGGVHGCAPGAMMFLVRWRNPSCGVASHGCCPPPPPPPQVGSYKECDINKLVPLDTFQLDTDVTELFYMVFKTDPRERPSAFGLLQDSRIKDGKEQSFDSFYIHIFNTFFAPSLPPSVQLVNTPSALTMISMRNTKTNIRKSQRRKTWMWGGRRLLWRTCPTSPWSR